MARAIALCIISTIGRVSEGPTPPIFLDLWHGVTLPRTEMGGWRAPSLCTIDMYHTYNRVMIIPVKLNLFCFAHDVAWHHWRETYWRWREKGEICLRWKKQKYCQTIWRVKYWFVVSRIEEKNLLIGLVCTYIPIFHNGIQYTIREMSHKTRSIAVAAFMLISAVRMYQVPTGSVLSKT